VFVRPANGNQHLGLALNIASFFWGADEHERDGEHEGEAQQGVEQEVGKNVLISIFSQEAVFQRLT
jgi:hypothetical protein